jgi:hypothetical protein
MLSSLIGSYQRKQVLVGDIICALGDLCSTASNVMPSYGFDKVKAYSDSNINIMESLVESPLLHLKSEKTLESYLENVKSDTRKLLSKYPKKL